MIVDGLSSCETREWSTFVFWTSESFLIIPSLRSRRFEVLGERKKRRARGRHAKGVGAVEKQSAHKFLYTLLLAEVSFRYGLKHLRSFSLSCFPYQAQKLKPFMLSLIVPFFGHLISSWLIMHITLAWAGK